MSRVKLQTVTWLIVCLCGTSMLILTGLTFDETCIDPVDDRVRKQIKYNLNVFQSGKYRIHNLNKLLKNLKLTEVLKIRAQLYRAGFSVNTMLHLFRNNSLTIPGANPLQLQSRENKTTELLDGLLGSVETCAVVGNSGILADSNCGSEIDSHDFVLRTNMAPTFGYESDVGRKTSLVSMNSAIAKHYFKCLRSNQSACFQKAYHYLENVKTSIVWLSKMHGVPSYVYYNVVSAFRKHKIDVVVTYPDRRLKEPLQSFWALDSIPSSGIFLYTLAGTFCKRISLYGFYPFNQTSSGKRLGFHYYEEVSFENIHIMPLEFNILTGLHTTGAIRHVTDVCV